MLCGKVDGQGFRSKIAYQFVGFHRTVDPKERAKPAWVVKTQTHTIFQFDINMIVLFRGAGVLQDS